MPAFKSNDENPLELEQISKVELLDHAVTFHDLSIRDIWKCIRELKVENEILKMKVHDLEHKESPPSSVRTKKPKRILRFMIKRRIRNK